MKKILIFPCPGFSTPGHVQGGDQKFWLIKSIDPAETPIGNWQTPRDRYNLCRTNHVYLK
jgi:hypothetical protein